MPFEYLDEHNPSSSRFTYLDESSNSGDYLKEHLKDISQGPQEVFNALNTPSRKLITGKSFEDVAREKSLAGQDIPAATSRPFDANVPLAGKEAFNNANIAQEKDLLTTPSMIMSGVAKPVSEISQGLGNAIRGLKNSIATKALSPEFAQDVADMKYGHDARRVISSMPDIIGEDAQSTKMAIANKTKETGQAIGQTISNSEKSNIPVGIKEGDVVGHIDDKISDLNKSDPIGNKRTVRALEAKKTALLNNFDANGNPIGPVDFENMTPQQLFDYKEHKLGDIKYTGRQGVDETALNSSLKESRGRITTKMNEVLPELKPLNQDYGDLKSAQDSIDKIILKGQKEGLSGLGIKSIITAGLNNPINRAKLAQFLYTAPKSEIASLEKEVPNMSEVVKSWFTQEYPNKSFDYFPNMGMAGKVGKDIPISKGGELTPEIVAGKGVTELPAPQKPILRQDRLLPNPRQAGQSSGPVIVGEPPSPTTPDPNDFLAEARNRLANNKGVVNIGDNLNDLSKPQLQESLDHYKKMASQNTGNPDRSQYNDAIKMINKINNAIRDVGKSTLGISAGTGILSGLAMGAKNADAKKVPILNDENAIKTVIGEGESTGFQGMRALASAIRNRGTLQGVYGIDSPRVVKNLYSPKTYRLARQAWEDSKKRDFSGGANHWFSDADLKKENVQKIIKGMQKLGSYRGNTFYKENRRQK